jgi:hypothetical protein
MIHMEHMEDGGFSLRFSPSAGEYSGRVVFIGRDQAMSIAEFIMQHFR